MTTTKVGKTGAIARRPAVWCALALALATVLAAPAVAQQYTGRIDFTVVDNTGGVLPGARVEVSGAQTRLG